MIDNFKYLPFDEKTLNLWKDTGVEFVEASLLIGTDKFHALVLLTPSTSPMSPDSIHINSSDLDEFAKGSYMVSYLINP